MNTATVDTIDLSLRVLGGFDLRVAGRSVRIPVNAQRVLAYLAVVAAEARRDSLAGQLWGLSTEARAHANLRTALWRIRQASPRLVAARRDEVRLGGEVTVDYAETQEQAYRLVNGAPVSERGLVRPGQLLEADLLPGWDEDWLVIDRERHRQLRLHALEALSRQLATAGDYGRAIDAAYAAIAVEPLLESARAALIEAHLAEGNRAEALRQYRAFRRLLHDETGLAPSAVLTAAVGLTPYADPPEYLASPLLRSVGDAQGSGLRPL
jgi:DNA-binding SARP family transcriptional activator